MAGGLSILMPVFDERSTIEAAIDDALTAELPVPSRELVIVDDGSTDGTRELLHSGEWPANVKVVYHERNLGKGAAVRTALQHASEEFAAILDADLEYRAADLAARPRAARLRRSARRLRHARLDLAVVLQLLVRDGEQGRDDGDQRPLQLLDLGRHDLPQGDAHRALPLAAASRARLRDRAGDRRARAPRRRADPRGADLVHGTRPRGGKEAHGVRRAQSSADARPLPRK